MAGINMPSGACITSINKDSDASSWYTITSDSDHSSDRSSNIASPRAKKERLSSMLSTASVDSCELITSQEIKEAMASSISKTGDNDVTYSNQKNTHRYADQDFEAAQSAHLFKKNNLDDGEACKLARGSDANVLMTRDANTIKTFAESRRSFDQVWFSKSGKILSGRYGLECDALSLANGVNTDERRLERSEIIWFPRTIDDGVAGEEDEIAREFFGDENTKEWAESEKKVEIVGDGLHFPGFDGGPYHDDDFTQSYSKPLKNSRSAILPSSMSRIAKKGACEEDWRKQAAQLSVPGNTSSASSSASFASSGSQQSLRTLVHEDDTLSLLDFLAEVDQKLSKIKEKAKSRTQMSSIKNNNNLDADEAPVVDTFLRPEGAGWAADWVVGHGN